jgi:hypothetical protein
MIFQSQFFLEFDKNLSTNAHNFSIILRVKHKKLNFQPQKKKILLKKILETK